MAKVKRGDYVTIITESGRAVRKVIWVSDNSFQWTGGEAKISQLEINPLYRKSKLILNLIKNGSS